MGIGQELKIANVTKYYGTFKVLDNVNLVCKPGEFISILGSSGSGKTTLLKVIAGFESVSDGKIFINSKDVAAVPCHERNIGMLFQNYALFPHLTVEQNIAYPLRLRKLPKPELEKRVKDMIALIKLTGLENRYPRQLSGGQQQRVGLARALVYNPPLLLLDEPLGALDKNLRHDMQFEIKRITRQLGITTVSVTHDQEEAFSMSDKICIVSAGVVQQFATPSEIYEKPSNRFVAQFMGTTNIIPIEGCSFEKTAEGTLVTGKTPLGPDPVKLCAGASLPAKQDVKDLYFTLRPEAIHLVKDGVKADNVFEAVITESIYLGSEVKLKAKAGPLELNITLEVKDFRGLGGKNTVALCFASEDTSLLFD